MSSVQTLEPMSAERSAVLGEFARACKSATRSVSLYLGTHPAIQASLSRVTAAAGWLISLTDVTLTVHPEALVIGGPLLREFGLSALMHDIGKVKTPKELLNKPEKLTDRECAILARHTVDGAEILRRTPEIPALAPVVAFEHHLRLDGTGRPAGVARPSLNLGTMMCTIADVYDAMRSKRVYQKAFPIDRILAALKRNDGTQFDQNLVQRFS
jgi:hypothetical protein